MMICLIILIIWLLLGTVGFLIYAKANDYTEVDPYIMDVCLCLILLGPIGLVVGAWELFDEIEIGPKFIQFLLNLINHKANKHKEK